MKREKSVRCTRCKLDERPKVHFESRLQWAFKVLGKSPRRDHCSSVMRILGPRVSSVSMPRITAPAIQ